MVKKAAWLLGAAALLAAGVAVGYFGARSPWVQRHLQSQPEFELLPEPHSEPANNPAERELLADLYVQTSAEYHALCLQTYRHAYECLLRRLKDPPAGDLPFAVVMDLDETVLDNSRYQSWAYRNGKAFDAAAWAAWEKEAAGEVGLVPGAGEFIEKVGKLDPPVKVVFISNRRDRPGTVAALERLKVGGKDLDQRLHLRTDVRDKERRRKEVEKTHRVLLLVGDSLIDLSSEFAVDLKDKSSLEQQANAIRARIDRVERNKDRFGRDWIILPNPVYGEWTEPLGDDPARHLRPTKFAPKLPPTRD